MALVGFALALLGAPAAQARNASIVMDFETGQVLHEANADTRNYPASLVKMMTLYMAFEALDRGNLALDQELPVSGRAAGMPPSKLGLKAGETITVRDVILALVTKSANDAAVVMAETLGTKETRFAQMMTKKARELGMRRTTFRNASGLPNRGQMSTARDMALLARAIIRDFPNHYDYFATADFTRNGRTHRNHNNLLRKYDGVDGLKTGYIRASGFNLAASAVRDDRRLIAVVLGGRSPSARDREVAKLLDRGFARAAALPAVAAAPARPTPRRIAAAAPATPVTDAALPGPAEDGEAGVRDDIGSGAPSVASAAEQGRAWGVQVGAYYRYELAERAAIKAAAELADLLVDGQIHVPSVRGQRGRIYRARLLGLSERDARGACRRLEAVETDCLVIRDPAALALRNAPETMATN